MTIDLYIFHLSSPARAALVTAQHLGVAVNTKEVNIFAGETRAPDYLALNPSHTVPTLNDNGFLLFESRAIMAYLVNQYSPNNAIYPGDAKARAQVDKILYFDATGYFPALKGAFAPVLLEKLAAPPQKALDELKEKLEILVTLLGEKKFFTGEQVTLADISLGTSVPFVKQLFPNLWPAKLEAWYERLVKVVPQVQQSNSKVVLK